MSEDGRLEPANSGAYAVAGSLSFATVPAILRQSGTLFAQPGNVVIDLGAVERTDSAGLALLVEWLRLARSHGRSITFRNVPAQLCALAHLSDLEQLLPIEGATPPGRGPQTAGGA